ncbi:hypothetical protein [Acidovorax sp. SUPP3334]|uniref:hypothetical protein n=1 Tax=Acidovorax sp. SUPP3334 TaxID=2920881 RepID=UPI0023DE4BE7|nr:hypothetical protein [Acidovorax sp. SUPP3334]GKT25126.1 hypothetical protein AVHM3334_16960 [Acidovorax sp. SUPP3334]
MYDTNRGGINELARLHRKAPQFPVPLTKQARTQVAALLMRHGEAVVGNTLLAVAKDRCFSTLQNCAGFYILGLSDDVCAAAGTADQAGIEEAIRWAEAEPVCS